MPFWSNPHDSSSRDPKRKFRFQVSFDAITDPNGNGSVMWYAKTVNKPSYQIATTEHKYLNHTFYYPGTVTWQDVSLTLVDPIEPDMSITLARILEKSGYSEVFDDSNQIDGSTYSDYNQIKDAVHAKLRN